MDELPEAIRQAAHVLLDILSVDPDTGDTSRWIETAFQRMHEVGAVTVWTDAETGAVRLDVTNLLSAMMIIVDWLTSRVAAATGSTETDVVLQVRGFLNDDEGE